MTLLGKFSCKFLAILQTKLIKIYKANCAKITRKFIKFALNLRK